MTDTDWERLTPEGGKIAVLYRFFENDSWPHFLKEVGTKSYKGRVELSDDELDALARKASSVQALVEAARKAHPWMEMHMQQGCTCERCTAEKALSTALALFEDL